MNTRILISWTSMITAFAQHDLAQQALDLFNGVRLARDRPNKVTCFGVLTACMIDMFVRLERLEEAFDFVKKMEFEPIEFIWSLLIAGCRSHGNIELGFYAAEQLLSIKPKDPEVYTTLMNMYVSAKIWKDVSRLRKAMKEENFTKLKDWSWISIKYKVYSFKPDDKSCYQCQDVHVLLEELLEKSRNLRYEWKENLEIPEDEEREDK